MNLFKKLFGKKEEKLLEIPVIHVEGAEDLALPKYKTDGAVGMDLLANVPLDNPITLNVGDFKVIPTGIRVELPENIEAQVRARSGNAKDFGIALVNGVGTIDYDYRGEIGAIIINMGHQPFTIKRGDRIAQLVFNEVKRVKWLPVVVLGNTKRGKKGYGSTKLTDYNTSDKQVG